MMVPIDEKCKMKNVEEYDITKYFESLQLETMIAATTHVKNFNMFRKRKTKPSNNSQIIEFVQLKKKLIFVLSIRAAINGMQFFSV